MEALVCGNTEVAPHDLLIRINKLARIDKKSKQTGYAQEFKVETNSLHDVFSRLYNQFLPVTILLPFNSNQGPISRKSRKLFGPEKPFLIVCVLKTKHCIDLKLCMTGNFVPIKNT